MVHFDVVDFPWDEVIVGEAAGGGGGGKMNFGVGGGVGVVVWGGNQGLWGLNPNFSCSFTPTSSRLIGTFNYTAVITGQIYRRKSTN